jgi:translation initiation factor IF-1
MPPNAKGGKGYKKGKHGGNDEPVFIECDERDNQMYGRVVENLGQRRFRVYCNDNVKRICKICGSMRKSEWVEKGLIVVISIRDLSESRFNTNSADIKIGDIIRIMDNRLYGKLKKMENVNPVLFTDIENTNDAEISRRLFAIQQGELQDDDIFDRGGSEGDAEAEGEDDEEGEEGEGQSEDAKLAKALAMKEKQKTRDAQLQEKRNTKHPSQLQEQEDNVDIDDL